MICQHFFSIILLPRGNPRRKDYTIQTISDALPQIIEAALKRVDPYGMVKECVSLDAGLLRAAGGGGEEAECDLDRYNRIVVLGAGKASAPMVRDIEEILGDRLSEG